MIYRNGKRLTSVADMDISSGARIVKNGATVAVLSYARQESNIYGETGNGLATFRGNRFSELNKALFEGKCEQDGTPTPDAPIAVKCNNSKWQASGKNLFNIQNINNLAVMQVTQVSKLIEGTSYRGYAYPCPPNTTVTISRDRTDLNSRFGLGFTHDLPQNGTELLLVSYNATDLKFTLTSPANTNYLYVYLSNSNQTISEDSHIQIEFNDHETPYEPYINNGTVDLSAIELRGIGDVKDEYDAQTGVLTRRVGKVDIASLNWVYHAPSSKYTAYFDCSIDDIKKGNSSVVSKLISDAGFTPIASGAIATAGHDNNVMAVAHNATRTIICCPSYSEASSFKSAMSGIHLYYELATPTTEVIAPQKLSQIKGTNTILQTSGDIPNTKITAEYYGA